MQPTERRGSKMEEAWVTLLVNRDRSLGSHSGRFCEGAFADTKQAEMVLL